MNPHIWNKVDDFVFDTLIQEDAALRETVLSSGVAGLPMIQVAPNQGKLLHLLAMAVGARRVLEIGTLGGYSTIWLARALPIDGELISLELDPKHAEVARCNIERANVAARVEVKVGAALETLQTLSGPFDLTFIDADKQNIPAYFEKAVELSRAGALIIVDNVVRDGQIADAASTDESVRGVRRLHEAIKNDARVSATTLQTVGTKGYDGLLIARVH